MEEGCIFSSVCWSYLNKICGGKGIESVFTIWRNKGQIFIFFHCTIYKVMFCCFYGVYSKLLLHGKNNKNLRNHLLQVCLHAVPPQRTNHSLKYSLRM